MTRKDCRCRSRPAGVTQPQAAAPLWRDQVFGLPGAAGGELALDAGVEYGIGMGADRLLTGFGSVNQTAFRRRFQAGVRLGALGVRLE